jgi:hypothetical protein
MHDSPIKCIDPDGNSAKDIIILLAQAEGDFITGAHPTGHMAVLIGDDVNGWKYYSKDHPTNWVTPWPSKGEHSISGEGDGKGGAPVPTFKNLAAFTGSV